MKRGEIWTASGGADYAGKPRPVVIVQSDAFPAGNSVTVCPFTSDPSNAPLLRLPVAPDPANGLQSVSRLMADKITTVSKTKLGRRVGRLAERDMIQLERLLLVFLGLAK